MTETKIDTPGKKGMTEKQREARMKNLLIGRKKRMENIKQRKKEEIQKGDEYNLSSDADNESESSDDDVDFIISKKKKVVKSKKTDKSKPRSRDDLEYPDRKNEIEELKNMVMSLALLQKKQNKVLKKQHTSKPVNKLVLLPPHAPQPESNQARDNMMEMLRRSLM